MTEVRSPAFQAIVPAPAGRVAVLHFDDFDILPSERRLLVRGAPAKLGSRAFDLLLALVAARDRVVSKDELLELVWPGLVVEENNLAVHISQLRKLCGSSAIATVPGRGYQFTATGLAQRNARPAARDADYELRPQAGTQGNLPADLPALIGRDSELDEVLRTLREQRWITITGPGGMGKTRLSEAVGQTMAAQMPVWFVELASISDPAFVPNAVAQALGVNIVDAQQPLSSITASLQERAALLILDNCEQVLGAVAALCRTLLARVPHLRLLVTSQEHMHANEETVYKLGPLTMPDPEALCGEAGAALACGALRLLRTRVRALSRQFEITAESLADAIVICQQLDGMPLAIELAAGRVPMLGLAGVRERLGERFRLLTGDARVRLRRHQTLRAALDWSYQLLAPREQALLRRIGVFAGSFSIEGVQVLADDLNGDEWGVLDTLGSLIDKSLVQVKGHDRPRYLLLETTRAYALEQLAANAETDAALDKHARATREVCRLATRRRDTQAIWDEVPNIRTAFNWALRNGEAELSVALVNESSVVLALGGLVGEVVQRIVEVEPCVTDQLPRPLAALYWQWLGRFGMDGRLPVYRCVAALQAAERLFAELGNHRHVHACMRMRAEALLQQGDLAAASAAIISAHALEQTACSPPADRMRCLRVEGMILDSRGRSEQALEHLERALAMARQADIHRYVLTLMQDIGQVLLHMGEIGRAEQHFRAVLEDPRRDITIAVAEAHARMGLLGALLSQQGRLGTARASALAAVPPLRSCGLLLAHAEVYAWLLATMGEAGHAAALLHTSDDFRRISQTARGPLQSRAYAAASRLLGEPLPPSGKLRTSENELAAMLTSALG